jgi:hypothetical protein
MSTASESPTEIFTKLFAESRETPHASRQLVSRVPPRD